MKDKEVIKLLIPGMVVGIVLGFGLAMIVGVDTANPIPNYIGWAICCFVPTLLNCTIVVKTGAKALKRNVKVSDAIARVLKYALVALFIGFVVIAGIIEGIMGVSSCEISVFITAVCQALLGVCVSTVMAYVAFRRYEKSVKYKRRTAKEKNL